MNTNLPTRALIKSFAQLCKQNGIEIVLYYKDKRGLQGLEKSGGRELLEDATDEIAEELDYQQAMEEGIEEIDGLQAQLDDL